MNRTCANRTVPLLLFLFVFPAPGCALFQSDPETLTLDTERERAFDEVQGVIASRFTVKTADRDKGRIETEWRMRPSEMGTKRKRLIARVKPSEETPGEVRITLRSVVQEVSDILKPYKTEDAEWEEVSRDRELEKALMKLIRFRLKSKEVEDEILDEIEEGAEQEQRLDELKRTEDPGGSSDD